MADGRPHVRRARPGRAKAAWRERGWRRAAIVHCDHGSVHTSRSCTLLCEDLGVVESMGQVGSSADNALAESFNAALQRELLEARPAWPDQATTHRAAFLWANRYNTRPRRDHPHDGDGTRVDSC